MHVIMPKEDENFPFIEAHREPAYHWYDIVVGSVVIMAFAVACVMALWSLLFDSRRVVLPPADDQYGKVEHE